MPYDEALATRVRHALAEALAADTDTAAEPGAAGDEAAARPGAAGHEGPHDGGDHAGFVEKGVVGGGVGFLVGGVMVVGVDAKGLFVRVGKDGYARAVEEPYAGPKLVGTRATTGFVSVDPAGTNNDDDLRRWVARGLAFTTKPPA